MIKQRCITVHYNPVMAGLLYVVATPIGNLEDITYRAVRILKEVNWIACEDTRTTSRLLQHYQIDTRTISYHDHNEQERALELVNRLSAGETGALVSDAGTPLLSDPGYRIVRAAAEAGIQVQPVPGASAMLAGLVISGLPTDQFHFGGFLPPKTQAREKMLRALEWEEATLIFYEAPHRIIETLASIQYVLGEREVCVARELTKVYEETIRGTAKQIAAQLQTRDSVRGEFVILIAKGLARADKPLDEAVRDMIAAGVDRMDAIKTVAHERGLSKREVYRIVAEK